MELSAKEKYELERAYQVEQDAKIKIRILAAIYMYIEGMTVEEASKLLRMGTTMVQKYRNMYREGGIEKLRNIKKAEGASSHLDNGQKDELLKIINKGMYLRAKDVCVLVVQKWGVKYTPNAMTKLLKKLGFTYKKPRPIPGKADAVKQKDFLENTLETLVENADEENPVYFGDAMHFRHNAQPAYGWILKGSQKEVRQNTNREQININGAYSLHNHKIEYRYDDRINKESNLLLLQQIRNNHPENITIHFILDNAPYNHAKILKEYASNNKIELHYLPSYSPNLNLIERFWRFLKRNLTYNTFYENFSIFIKKVTTFLEETAKSPPDNLKSLMTTKFNIIGANSFSPVYSA